MSKLLTVQEVADILKIKKTTVYEMIKRGELPSTKIGKQLRITEETLNRKLGGEPAARPSAPMPMPSVPSSSALVNSGGNLILCGQDIALDIISNHFNTSMNMPNILRSHAGSYNSLYLLYQGKAHVATCHLWDEESGEYNVSYVKRLLPGIPVIMIRLFGRHMGLYVRKGNPQHITCWEDFARKDITLVNREKGSGTRILLDEKLKKLKLNRLEINGYGNEYSSHLSVASAVARGEGNVGLGIQFYARQIREVEFIPLQNEWYDMVFLADQLNTGPFKALLDYVASEAFMNEIMQIDDYDFSQTGKIHRF